MSKMVHSIRHFRQFMHHKKVDALNAAQIIEEEKANRIQLLDDNKIVSEE